MMITLFLSETPQQDSLSWAKIVLKKHFGVKNPTFLIGRNGKPYLENSPLFFNLSHSGNLLILAVATQEVGIDVQEKREKHYSSIQSRLTLAEQKEDFFRLWTAKESYVKYRGETLASLLKTLTFEQGVLYENGERAQVCLSFIEEEFYTVCICTHEQEEISLRIL